MKKDNNDNSTTTFMPIFMCIGISVGMAIGAPTGNIPIGMSIGIGFGLCVGGIIDALNRRKCREGDADKNNAKEK